ncbi:winged helix-turn-helix domain-containing protein [Ruegeria sp. 2205SS24-7]|uniref:ArsR/SmtB family transcription factor n=1 Tax=Ruegeria discodermiae TaxID=3064389 RepID=UPI00274090F4|nr:winged helix-turn-helix domain-containing protein [Ruegeria sp. 2205SS24-7]MDP5218345.1 winged helix-turn-helix domain-containing protein [Ruegeria sp. 2205SS24-7]
MKDGPDIARIAALIGDPARANMLGALMSGKALTATELAHEAGITPQTASSHLRKLLEGGLVRLRGQGRHRYYALSGHDVAETLESLMGLAAGRGHLRTRTGPRDAALRKARVCYNHLAGERGVALYRSMIGGKLLVETDEDVSLTPKGERFAAEFGIDLTALRSKRAPLCRPCLDWSAREHHLAGSFGRAMLTRMEALGWLTRQPDSRVIRFTEQGEAAFGARFPT